MKTLNSFLVTIAIAALLSFFIFPTVIQTVTAQASSPFISQLRETNSLLDSNTLFEVALRTNDLTTNFVTRSVRLNNLFSNRHHRGFAIFNGYPFTNSPWQVFSNTLPLWHITTNGSLMPGLNDSFIIGSASANQRVKAITSRTLNLENNLVMGVGSAGGRIDWGGLTITNDGSNPAIVFDPDGTGKSFKIHFGPFGGAALAGTATFRRNNNYFEFISQDALTNMDLRVRNLELAGSNGILFAQSATLASGTKDVGIGRGAQGRLDVSDGSTGQGSIKATNVTVMGNLFSKVWVTSTNTWTLNQYYTNGATPGMIHATFRLTGVAGNVPEVRFLLDEDGDGTFNASGICASFSSAAADFDIFQNVTEFLAPGARFCFTNTSASGTVSIGVGRSRWKNF